MTISGRHLEDGAHIIVDGRRVPGTISVRNDKDETVRIELEELPEVGIHFLQVQNRQGLFSNDFFFHVAEGEGGDLDLGEIRKRRPEVAGALQKHAAGLIESTRSCSG